MLENNSMHSGAHSLTVLFFCSILQALGAINILFFSTCIFSIVFKHHLCSASKPNSAHPVLSFAFSLNSFSFYIVFHTATPVLPSQQLCQSLLPSSRRSSVRSLANETLQRTKHCSKLWLAWSHTSSCTSSNLSTASSSLHIRRTAGD